MNHVYIEVRQDEYEELLGDQRKLRALERAGVDNWEYYDDAMATLEEGEE